MIQLITGTKGTRTKQDPCPFCPNFSIKNFIVMIVWFPVIKELFENVFFFFFYFLFCNNYRITSCCKMHGSSWYTNPVSPHDNISHHYSTVSKQGCEHEYNPWGLFRFSVLCTMICVFLCVSVYSSVRFYYMWMMMI